MPSFIGPQAPASSHPSKDLVRLVEARPGRGPPQRAKPASGGGTPESLKTDGRTRSTHTDADGDEWAGGPPGPGAGWRKTGKPSPA